MRGAGSTLLRHSLLDTCVPLPYSTPPWLAPQGCAAHLAHLLAQVLLQIVRRPAKDTPWPVRPDFNMILTYEQNLHRTLWG